MVGEGDEIGGFRVLRMLGRGGFGAVYLGERADGQRAAVKLIRNDIAAEDMEVFRERFAREVEAARKVKAFCIASVLDADPYAEQPWLATEYIDGPTLGQAVRDRGPRAGGDLERLAVSTTTALTAIHRAGVVHRDFKPDNIMLAPDGPRVIDFGIARAFAATATTASAVIGTPAYMAPEQFEDSAQISAAVDIFALGAVLVFAATGRAAFAGSSPATVMAKILRGQADLSGVPGELLPLVHRCLTLDPAERPSAHELLNLLLGHGTDGGLDSDDALAEGQSTVLKPTLRQTSVLSPDPAQKTLVEPTAAREDAAPPGPDARPAPRSGAGPEPAPPPRPASTSGHPPYRLGETRCATPGDLAAAMQRNWAEAVRVFSAEDERAALRDWVIEVVGDTMVDRTLLRRAPDNPDLAVARFIAQLRPDLPPVYQGEDMTLEALLLSINEGGSAGRVLETSRDKATKILRVMAEHHCAGTRHYSCTPGMPCEKYDEMLTAAASAFASPRD